MNERIKAWTDLYLQHIERITPRGHVEHEEGYKFLTVNTFQANFDLEAVDLAAMLDRAIYHNNLTMGAMYFPRKMLLHFAADFPEETRAVLRDLFNESEPVAMRITRTEAAFDEINARYANARGQEKKVSFMGLRFLSLLLGLYAPNTYNAIKPREWKVFCKFLDPEFLMPQHTPSGEQYVIFSKYIDALREYIQPIPYIQNVKDELTAGISFKDEGFRWMTQDVIYVTARLYAKQKGNEIANAPEYVEQPIQEVEQESISISEGGMEFPLELYLEHFMVQNWNSIDFGEPLHLYVDPDGVEGRQYVTDVGIIDILARDAQGNFVVLELKRGKGNFAVIGQILSYITWVQNNLAEEGQTVRGIVIVSEGHVSLLSAQAAVADRVAIKYYNVSLKLKDPE